MPFLMARAGTINPFRSRSYYFDAETGWYYLNSRYYDPQVGRFLNADGIIGANGGIIGYNMFAYCNNDPVNFADPSGYAWWMPRGIGQFFSFGPATIGKGYSFNKKYDLGSGWYARFDRGTTGNSDHIHVWQKGKEWVMKLDGSISHENRSNEGSPPKSALKKLKEKTGFDYDKTRNDFLKKDTKLVGTEYGLSVVYYTDGTIYVKGKYYYTNSPNYSEDLWRPSQTHTIPFVFFPIYPSYGFSFGFSFVFDYLVPIFT